MKSDERSQATGSKENPLPKVDETRKMIGSSKDTVRRLMKAADGTPFPHDDDEDFKDPEEKNFGKDLDRRKVVGKDSEEKNLEGLNELTDGKAGKDR